MSKESFKDFARLHPELARSVVSNKVSWQKLYELYEIYGENSSVWNEYFDSSLDSDNKLGDIMSTIKKVDLKSVQNGIQSIQKVVGLLQDIGVGKVKDIPKNDYEARPLYKYFED